MESEAASGTSIANTESEISSKSFIYGGHIAHHASPRLPERTHPISPYRTFLRVNSYFPIWPTNHSAYYNCSAPPVSIDQVVSDFDGVTFHISTPETKSKILISINVRCWKELVQYGVQDVLEREYGDYITSAEPGYNYSILVDLETLPAEPEAREELVRRISLMKRNVMAAPFEKAFDEYQELATEADKFTRESAPEGLTEGGEVMAIHYRDEEAIYIKANHDQVTVIFSTIFREETDRVYGKIFLQVCRFYAKQY